MQKAFFWMMLVGYVGCAIFAPTPRLKVTGILLALVNGILFW